MKEFFKGCAACNFCEKGPCPEECFECVQPNIIRETWLHSIGVYFPRTLEFKEQHRISSWTQAILRTKKHFTPDILETFGRVGAYYIDKEMACIKPYLITNVPGYTMQFVAYSVFNNLKTRKDVDVKQLLIQTRMKVKKQHHCSNDRQRKRNVQGVYAVKDSDSITGRNIILLDDVVTSGATIQECTKKLFEAGAKTVVAIALARTFRMTSLALCLN